VLASLSHGKERILVGRRNESGGNESLKSAQGEEKIVAQGPWSFEVWYDKKRPSISMVRKECPEAQMVLRGMVAGATADCAADTGGGGGKLSFISAEFLKRVNITPQHLDAVEVEVATGDIAKVEHQVKLRTVFKSLPFVHTYYVLPELVGGCDVLLGMDFLKRYKAQIDVAQDTCTFWNRGRGVILKSISATARSAKLKSNVISARLLVRCMKQGCPVFVGMVNKKEGHDNETRSDGQGHVHVDRQEGSEGCNEGHSDYDHDDNEFKPGFGPTNKADVPSDKSGLNHPICQHIRAEFSDVFSEKLEGLPPDRHLFHTIPLYGEHVPPSRPGYR
jgi:hypothetical protein